MESKVWVLLGFLALWDGGGISSVSTSSGPFQAAPKICRVRFKSTECVLELSGGCFPWLPLGKQSLDGPVLGHRAGIVQGPRQRRASLGWGREHVAPPALARGKSLLDSERGRRKPGLLLVEAVGLSPVPKGAEGLASPSCGDTRAVLTGLQGFCKFRRICSPSWLCEHTSIMSGILGRGEGSCRTCSFGTRVP